MKIITNAAMRDIDRRSIRDFGYTAELLMESAAIHIWQKMRPHLTHSDRVLVLCGKGNNGGDGFAVARWAHIHGYRVDIVDCAKDPHQKSELNRMHTAICLALHIPCYLWHVDQDRVISLLAAATHIVDALVGVGSRGEIAAPLRPLISAVNNGAAHIYALDIPSGIGEDFVDGHCAIRASTTYTIAVPKVACFTPLARPYCGAIEVIPIGFPPVLLEAEKGGDLLDTADIKGVCRSVSPFSYKHRRGVIAIYAGRRGTIGAALMAADGASAAGCGVVHLFPHPQDSTDIATARAEYIIHRPESRAEFCSHIDDYDALCIGPGWGVDDHTRALLYDLIHAAPRGVIDADGITILSEALSLQKTSLRIQSDRLTHDTLRGWIITPHCAEFARLLGIKVSRVLENPLHYLHICAQQLQVVVVLKSYVTHIVDPHGRYAILDGNEASLATAGSGDVLAGIASGLLTQGYDPFDAAKLAALIHLDGGIAARKKYGFYRAALLAKCVAKNMYPHTAPSHP